MTTSESVIVNMLSLGISCLNLSWFCFTYSVSHFHNSLNLCQFIHGCELCQLLLSHHVFRPHFFLAFYSFLKKRESIFKPLFFLILGLQIFFKILRSEEGKKFFLFNLRHIWIGVLSFLHFYSVKSYNFCNFFLIFNFILIWQFFTSEKIKIVKNKILIFF